MEVKTQFTEHFLSFFILWRLFSAIVQGVGRQKVLVCFRATFNIDIGELRPYTVNG